ncbi:Angiotensin-converting enzyme [Halotydeus destructor]|nr:Angiotensin-converting enzyme [Halotydeus destructor]
MIILVVLAVYSLNSVVLAEKYDEAAAVEFMKNYNEKLRVINRKNGLANFANQCNLTDYNAKLVEDTVKESIKFDVETFPELKKFKYETFKDKKLKRMFKRRSIIGSSALDGDKALKMAQMSTNMTGVYSQAKICVKGKCGLSLDPDVSAIFNKERDWDTLSEAWLGWRDATGKVYKPVFKEYLALAKEVAEKNNLEDYGAYYRFPWEDKKLPEKTEKIVEEFKPLYLKLHAFTRKRLTAVYKDKMPKDGTIPAHLLGNMWAQSWNNLDILVPFKSKGSVDVTGEMVKQGYTVKKIFKMADEFFVSIGLNPLSPTFYEKSMLEKPKDRKVVCHPSASDFMGTDDFAIKQCTEINQEYFITSHHEMGHIQYYMLYKDQPTVFREGANNGFHEAVGDMISLSVGTVANLKRVGLIKKYSDDEESLINYLMFKALERLPVIPFAYIADLWRWELFEGKIKDNSWNRRYWEMRLKYQGVSPPVKRSEADFDLGCKSHIADDMPYVRYLYARIYQFQFHEALCKIAGHEGKLHECNIHGNKKVGDKVKEVLSQGSSLPWPEQLKQFTGSEEADVSSLLNYFKPLSDYLDKELEGEKLGWEGAKVDDYFEK